MPLEASWGELVGEGLDGVHREALRETLGLSVLAESSVAALAEISRAV